MGFEVVERIVPQVVLVLGFDPAQPRTHSSVELEPELQQLEGSLRQTTVGKQAVDTR